MPLWLPEISLSTKPAGDAALSLGGLLLDLPVDLIDLLQRSSLGVLRISLGVLCIRLSLGLGLLELGLRFCDLFDLRVTKLTICPSSKQEKRGAGGGGGGMGGQRVTEGTYGAVELCARLLTVCLGFFLGLLAAAGELRLDLCGGLVCVG